MKKIALVCLAAFILSACKKTNNTSPGYIYVIINNTGHFSGQQYVNVIVAGNNVAQTATDLITQSVDTLQVQGAGSSLTIQPVASYTINTESYTVSNNNPVPPIYRADTTVTVASGQTKYVTVTPQ